jgi:hypothetical protein
MSDMKSRASRVYLSASLAASQEYLDDGVFARHPLLAAFHHAFLKRLRAGWSLLLFAFGALFEVPV